MESGLIFQRKEPMKFTDGVILCHLIIVFLLLLLIIGNRIGEWLLKLRERDVREKEGL